MMGFTVRWVPLLALLAISQAAPPARSAHHGEPPAAAASGHSHQYDTALAGAESRTLTQHQDSEVGNESAVALLLLLEGATRSWQPQ